MILSCRVMDNSVPSETVAPRRKARGQGGWRPGAGRKPELEDAVSVTLHLERPQIERLREIAEAKDVSVASLIRKAVDGFLRRRRK